MKQSLLLIVIYFFSFSALSQSEPNDLVYRRSSLYTLMISDENKAHQEVIQNSFINYPIPEKFNSHSLEKRTIPKTINDSVSKKELYVLQQQAITDFLTTNDVAKFMVAKWFNRSEEGGFNMNLISERGHYNATDIDVKIARNSELGTVISAVAGEELNKYILVLIINFRFSSIEVVTKKTNSILSAVSRAASQSGASVLSVAVDTAAEGVDILGKGYVIKTDSYLY